MNFAKAITATFAVLLGATVLYARMFQPWLLMWTLAFEMFMFFKWVTLAYSSIAINYKGPYLFAWVGMDPTPFAQKVNIGQNPSLLIEGTLNFALGCFLMLSAQALNPFWWLVQAWMICVGLAFVLHFGIFKILASILRGKGFDVEPIMHNPLAAKTVAEFWGGRWNAAFKQLVFPFIFNPLMGKLGKTAAIFLTFLFSGIVHEIVISFPAQGGWGLPMLYFLTQPVGMMIERLKIFAALPALLRRCFTILVVAGPAVILFHPKFMLNVILPFGRFLGLHVGGTL